MLQMYDLGYDTLVITCITLGGESSHGSCAHFLDQHNAIYIQQSKPAGFPNGKEVSQIQTNVQQTKQACKNQASNT